MKFGVFVKDKNRRSLVGLQAGLMSLGTLVSRVMGFVRDLSIAAFFSKTETDIFFVAFRFPNFFRRLLGEGSFSASLTPALTETLQKSETEAKKLHSLLFTFLFCVSGALSLLGSIFMDDIINLFFANSAYASVEGKLEKTVFVGRIVFAYLFFVSLYSYFMSVAQVFGKFFIPALAPAFFNLSLIVFAWTPQSWWPFPSVSLAWAVLLGGLLQLAPALYEIGRLNFYPRFSFFWRNRAFLDVGRRFLPGALGLSGLALIGLINVYFAGWLEEGAPSYIYYGDRLLEFPRALIAVSIGTALIPALTRHCSLKQMTEFKNATGRYLRLALFLTLPCALVFLISAQPLVELLFGRGEFDSLSALKTSTVLKIYSGVLIFSSLSRILSSCFFALNKNWHVVISALLFVGFHGGLAWILTPLYGLKGLAGATALSSVFHCALLSGFLFSLIGGARLKKTAIMLAKILPGLGLLALCLMAYPYIFNIFSLFLPASLSLPLALLPAFLFGGGLYILSGLLLREETAFEFIALFQKFFRIKRPSKGPAI